jgi:ATP-dependent Clp protease ATP-binding subunit ClpB
VDFKNSILIMTSNLGSHIIMEMAQSDPDGMRREVDTLLHRQFKPEFLNRIDEIITFQGLSREDLFAIVDIQIKRMAKRLADRKYMVSLTREAKQFLVEAGYDPSLAPVPLKGRYSAISRILWLWKFWKTILPKVIISSSTGALTIG